MTRFFEEDLRAQVAPIFLMIGLIVPQALLAGTVLESGEMDRSTEEADAFAVVFYGQRERHSLLGDYREQLVKDRGYIQAVDTETLAMTYERNRRTQLIPLNYIQRPVFIGFPSLKSTDRDSTDATIRPFHKVNWGKIGYEDKRNGYEDKRNGYEDKRKIRDKYDRSKISSKYRYLHDLPYFDEVTWSDPVFLRGEIPDTASRKPEYIRTGGRIAAKLSVGFLIGCLSGFCGITDYSLVLWVGSVLGIASSMSLIESQDWRNQFLVSLIGTMMGSIVGVNHMYALESETFWPIFVYPSVMATVASERLRHLSEYRRVSVSLVSDREGILSVVAKLRF